jgi:hypothetical protein
MAKRRRKKTDDESVERRIGSIGLRLGPFGEMVRERAVLEGVTPQQWIRDAIADRLRVDRVTRLVGNPTFGHKPKPEIVDKPEGNPVDSSINSFWD